MPTKVRCINGHDWLADSSAGTGRCPTCGVVELLLPTPPTLPEHRPVLSLGSGSGPKSTPLEKVPPPTLTNYEILEEIGVGGMGIVYRARNHLTKQIVAIKLIRKERLTHADFLNRFRREAMASSRLTHPNIVQILATELDSDPAYLALEYVPGITLQRLVEEGGPLSVALACDFMRQTAAALQHATEQRLVHRDIKPANLMVVSPNGLPLPPRPLLKILDMGVARVFQLSEHEVSLTTLTRDGSVIGTPDYIAPEQIENPRTVDIRADLYSLGCTFYFLLTGQVPFPGGSLIQKLDRQRWETPRSVNQLRTEIPAPLAAVIRRLLAKHADDRYQTPAEVIAALDSLLKTGDVPDCRAFLTLRPIQAIQAHLGGVTALAFAIDGKSLVTGGMDRLLRVWDLGNAAERLKFGDGKYPVGCLAIVPTNGMILAGQGVTIRCWDVQTGREICKLSGHNDAVRCLFISSNGKRAVSGSDDRTIRLWDLDRKCEIQRIGKHKGGITGVAMSANGKYIYSCSHDQTIRQWDANTGKELKSYPAPRGPILCLALSHDEEGLYTGHFDTTVRFFDVASTRELRRFGGHKQMVGGIECLVDGRLITAGHDTMIRLWDTASGADLAQGAGHTGAVTSVAVSLDGKMVASGSLDQTVRLWELPK